MFEYLKIGNLFEYVFILKKNYNNNIVIILFERKYFII